MFKKAIIQRLQRYVKRYVAAHPHIKLVVVVGSVGKTGTKHAIATLLEQKYRVRMHSGNYNSEVSVPLAMLGIDLPARLSSGKQWLAVFRAAARRVKAPSDVDVIVQELGTDSPGDIAAFGSYLRPDIAVVTAITPEHMEFFGTLDAVAHEELAVAGYSKQLLVNSDDIDPNFLEGLAKDSCETYGLSKEALYRFVARQLADRGYSGKIVTPELGEQPVSIGVIGKHSLRPVVAAVAVAAKFGLSKAEIAQGIAALQPVPGRMNLLPGKHDITVLDDSYNASPAAVAAALATLYEFGSDTTQRIAVLGDMRELGSTSKAAHEAIGRLCEPTRLSQLIVVGPDTTRYLAPIARARGCDVNVARSALEAGELVRSIAKPGAVVLVKGSQNTIFLEECTKQLVDGQYHDRLVRQSSEWLSKKSAYFASLD